jgi:hypothetical protein
MIYDRRFGLPQSSVDYLNQPLPDISGIFSLPQYQAVVPSEEIEESLAPTGLTPEQLALLYPQYNLDRGGDGPKGGGDFGNLDLSTAKQFNINGNIVTGYKNLNTGLYQDISGKNLQNLGGNTIYGGILDALSEKMGFKRNQPTYPGLLDMVSPKALFKNPYLAKSFFDRQDVAKQQKIQDEIAAYNFAKIDKVRADRPGGGDFGASRRGDSDISDSQRGGFATDDTAGFF